MHTDPPASFDQMKKYLGHLRKNCPKIGWKIGSKKENNSDKKSGGNLKKRPVKSRRRAVSRSKRAKSTKLKGERRHFKISTS
jgi:hypothetical protein